MTNMKQKAHKDSSAIMKTNEIKPYLDMVEDQMISDSKTSDCSTQEKVNRLPADPHDADPHTAGQHAAGQLLTDRGTTVQLPVDPHAADQDFADQLPADQDVTDQDTAVQLDGDQLLAEQEAALQKALAMVFNDVRKQSADSQLVKPERWFEADIVPSHLGDEDFEFLVYDLIKQQQSHYQEKTERKAQSSAQRCVGVPPSISKAMKKIRQEQEVDESPSDLEEGESHGAFDVKPAFDEELRNDQQSESESLARNQESEKTGFGDEHVPDQEIPCDIVVPDGLKLVLIEGELCAVPIESEEEQTPELAYNDINVLLGKTTYYLYSRNFMTDAYAHWAFLACEDDRVLTFVDCVREESRSYPRPMSTTSFSNPPFEFDAEEVDRLWQEARTCEDYADIKKVTASNGDIYYFSSNYLGEAYAQSLAEWNAVERFINP